MNVLKRWVLEYAAAAEADDLKAVRERIGGYVDDPDATARRDLEAQIEAVVMLVSYRLLNKSPEAAEAVERFLSKQVYGRSGSEIGSRFTLRLTGPFPVVFHIDSLDEVDLEDLRDSMYYEGLQIWSHRGEFDEESVQSLLEEIESDLTYDGEEINLRHEWTDDRLDVDVEWIAGWD